MVCENDKCLITTLRIVSFGCGVGLIALGITAFISFSYSGIRGFFVTLYYILFGILICLSEMPCDKLLSCFYFLKYYIGKSLFYLFLATITFTWTSMFYLIISILLFGASGMYFILFIGCMEKQDGDKQGADKPGEEQKYEKREIPENNP